MQSQREKVWNFFECLFKNELGATSSQVEQPAWIQTPLFPHQRTSVHAALELEHAKQGMHADSLPGADSGTLFANYGILGDRVGSGKSLTALSLIKYPPPPTGCVEYSWRPNTYQDNHVGFLRHVEPTDCSAVPTALFLMPHAIIGQWEDYVKQDTTLKCHFIKKRKDAEDNLAARLHEYDAIFVSATMWREFENVPGISNILWSRVFIDEADTIMFSASTTDLRGRFLWLISASWMNLVFSGGASLNTEYAFRPLENTNPYIVKRIQRYISNQYINVSGIRSPVIRKLCGNVALSGYNVGLLNPVLYQATRLIIHNSDEFIQRSFETPEIQHIHSLCLTPPNIQILRSIVSEDIMERLHAGDAEGALTVLGIQTRTADQIVAAVRESVEKELEQVRRTYEFKKTIEYASEAAKTRSLQQYEDRMARLTSRIQAIEERLTNTKEQTCPICFEEVQTPAMTPCCRNLFCFACICEVLRRATTCPLCREIIPSIQSLHVLGPERETATNQLLTKQEQMRKFLRESPQARILLFSAYDATFSGLEAMLEVEGVTHATLSGSQARIAKLLKQFGEGKYRVLFLNAKNMGAGLNIAAASHVILYHKMPVETKNQIIGRAVRAGRTEPLTVLHFLHGNEMVSKEEGLTGSHVIQHV